MCGAIAIERTDLAVVPLRGADTLRYLHLVCSQHTERLRPGDTSAALLLSAKGKIEFAFRIAVLDDGETVLLDTEAEAAPALAERLARFVFRYDVKVGDPQPGVLTLLGPETAAASLMREAAPVAAHPLPGGLDLIGGDGTIPKVPEAPGVAVATAPLEAWERHRIAAGLPRWGRELTDDVIAEEAGLLGSHVHLDKGCYPGQETVARVHNLGQVQRRLAGLRFKDPDAPPPAFRADLVSDDGRRAGQVRGAIHHPELGTIALAYVRRVIDPGRLVLAGDQPATVVRLPFR
ncbi:MAG TPA: folate-binding protein [Actinomycetota bacterium]